MDAARPFDYSAKQVTLLVVGTAPCVMDDLTTARALRTNRIVMAVNFASGLIPADMIFSFHAELMDTFRALQAKFGPRFTTHSDTARGIKRAYPAVDYFWNGLHVGATSGIGAAHVGLLMGFREVILCGCPLNGTATPVGRPADLPITLPCASTRRPVVYLPAIFRSAGASEGASMKVCAASTA